MINQHGLTVRAPIKAGQEEDLRTLLNHIGDDVIRSKKLPFDKLTTVHYCRFVMVDGAKFKGKAIAPSLVLSTNYDGKPAHHLQELADVGGAGLDLIFQHCEGYPGKPNEQNRITFLRKHTIPTTTFYTGSRGRAVQQVRDEDELHEGISNGLLNKKDFSKDSPSSIVQAINKFVGDGSLDWALTPSKPFSLGYHIQYYGQLILVGLILLALLPLIIFPIGPWWWFTLKRKEKTDTREDQLIPLAKDQLLASREDILIQNQMSHLVDVKPGFFRQFTLRFVLWAVGFLGKYYWNKGDLGGIPTIHFARWVILDGGKRLLFFSNFDGSWQNYLGDFIDKASVGLTGVWTNTVNFPRTQNLIYAGAEAEEPFKRWARFYQIPSQVWYTAYPNVSVENVNNNSEVRKRIAGKSTGETDAEWLRRF